MSALDKRTRLANAKARVEIDDARDDAMRYRTEAMSLRNEVECLETRIDDLETQIREHQCSPIATISVPGQNVQAPRTVRVPPPHPPVPPPGVPAIIPPGFTPGVFAETIGRATRSRGTRTSNTSAAPPTPIVTPPVSTPAAPTWPALPTGKKGGGQSTTPHPSSLVQRRQPHVSNYDEDDSDEDTMEVFMGKDYKAPVKPAPSKVGQSNLAHQIQAILGNRPVAGRGGWSLTPQTNQEWDHARRSLDDAHSAGHAQTEELLRALRRYITTANEVAAKDRSTGSSNLTDVQRHALLQWRAPDWERVSKWDPQSGTVVKTDTTKAQRREKRVAAGNRADKLVQQLSDRLGLSVNGQPHPYLGDIASPRHSDHPDLWGEYSRSMTKKPPRGFAFGTDGYPFQRHTRAFCRFAPLFRGTTGHMNTHRGQIMAMTILARSRYGEGLIETGARPSSIPDWSPIEFSEATTEREIILEFARRGITEDEALDASDFAFSWLTDTLVTEQNDDYRHFITSALSGARGTAAPWPERMQFEYNEAYRRWVPVIPVPTMVTAPVTDERSATDAPPSSEGNDANPQETPQQPASSTSEDVDLVLDPIPESGDKPLEMEVDGDEKTAGGPIS